MSERQRAQRKTDGVTGVIGLTFFAVMAVAVIVGLAEMILT
jgi:hypothetical protein